MIKKGKFKIKNHNEISTIERSIIINDKLYYKAFYKETNKIQLSCHPLTHKMSLENIINEVELFEINKNEGHFLIHPFDSTRE